MGYYADTRMAKRTNLPLGPFPTIESRESVVGLHRHIRRRWRCWRGCLLLLLLLKSPVLVRHGGERDWRSRDLSPLIWVVVVLLVMRTMRRFPKWCLVCNEASTRLPSFSVTKIDHKIGVSRTVSLIRARFWSGQRPARSQRVSENGPLEQARMGFPIGKIHVTHLFHVSS